MIEASKIVENLEIKMNRLIASHQSKTNEINQLIADKEELAQLVKQQKNEIGQLNERVKIIKLAKSMEGFNEENSKLKLKINEVVREVDKCIAMLNK